jgi:predicted nucleotide-binding protein
MSSSSEGLSVDDKVDKYIKKCAASIILYTPDDELKDGSFLPRQNVIHETGILQREMPDKIVYLKESSVILPTNITPKVYASFLNDNLTEAFIQIIKEFKSFGIL